MQPEIELVVCTRDRPDDLARLLPSIAGQQGVDFRCILVDQSTDSFRNRQLVDQLDVPWLEYVRDDGVGKSRALNIALRRVSAAMVAFTDDDCVLPPRWLVDASAALAQGTDVLFGAVTAAPHDPEAYFVPVLELYRDERYTRATRPLPTLIGMGACMAMRTEVLARVGGFDESLGPGSRFGTGEDTELAHRALRAGLTVRRSPDWTVEHFGMRPVDGSVARSLVVTSFYALGVGYGKHARAGSAFATRICLTESVRGLRRIAGRLVSGHRPLGWGSLLAFWKGVVAGARVGPQVPSPVVERVSASR